MLERHAPHGTASRYKSGSCRCVACRKAWADYIRARARAQGRRPRGSAARRMGLAHRSGEDASAYAKRIGETWLRADLYYPDRTDRTVTVRPTWLGLRILDAVQARTGRDHDDIVEQLLRESGARLMSFEFDAERDRTVVTT